MRARARKCGNSDYAIKSCTTSVRNVGYKLALFFPVVLPHRATGHRDCHLVGRHHPDSGCTSRIAGNLTIGKLIAFNNYAMMAMFPLMMLGFVLNFISMAMASAVRLDALFREKPSIEEKTGCSQPRFPEGENRIPQCVLSLRGGRKGLNDIDLVIQPGEKLGIIGTTGAGKSSLVNLIPRFYDPEEGCVLLDDIDVRDLSFDTLRTRVAMVLQETILFSGTIRDNIAFGAPNASQPDLERAAEIACAMEFISEKPDGWGFLGRANAGAGLSGGQRQRVAIARAIAAAPDIIILDDVTSSLDATTERRIVEGLYREFRRPDRDHHQPKDQYHPVCRQDRGHGRRSHHCHRHP